ncbi:hypothetical protein F5884DRAFT_6322 [Xylogone sp. PMI_703]|nr:hypothetical protein F5884DRAFT_6322 [Xylogone sp. PMI_703]
MELPSYEDATRNPEVFTLVTQWIDPASLARCCAVSKRFKEIFSPVLWSDPINIMSLKKQKYHRIYLFLDKAENIQETNRALVTKFDFRNLRLRGVGAEDVYDFHSYASEIKGRLLSKAIGFFPNVRFLVTEGLDGFSPSTSLLPSLLLLGANGCPFDFTSVGPSMQSLVYLDMSGTLRPAGWLRDTSCVLPNLRVLKMRRLQLTDRLMSFVINRLGLNRNLWSLDVRDNLLTDAFLEDLLMYCCFSSASSLSPSGNGLDPTTVSDIMYYEEAPGYSAHPMHLESQNGDPNRFVRLRPDDIDGSIAYLHDTDLSIGSWHLREDYLTVTGLTHLYLSGNKLSSQGISNFLLRTNRLQTLDTGSVRTNLFSPNNPYLKYVYGQPKFVDVIQRSHARRLEMLRIHHCVITGIPSVRKAGSVTTDLKFLAKEEELRSRQQNDDWKPFLPDIMPSLRVLTLVDVPRKSTGFLIDRLIEFITACAIQEKKIAEARDACRHHRSPRLLTGLRQLCLEFEATTPPQSPTGPSVSGDPDADEFMAQSSSDFTFFEGEQPSSTRTPALSHMDSGQSLSLSRTGTLEPAEFMDVAQALKDFRGRKEEPWWGGKLSLVLNV